MSRKSNYVVVDTSEFLKVHGTLGTRLKPTRGVGRVVVGEAQVSAVEWGSVYDLLNVARAVARNQGIFTIRLLP